MHRGRLMAALCAPVLALLLTAAPAAAQPPVAPTLNSALGSGGYTFSWNAVPFATWYYLWVNDSSGPKYTVWYTKEEAGCPNGTGVCILSLVLPPMLPGAGIWYVQSWNGSGSAWAAGQGFIVRHSAPYIIDNTGKYVGMLLDPANAMRDLNGAPAQFPVFPTNIYLQNQILLYYTTNNCSGQAYATPAIPDRLTLTGGISNGWLTRSLPGLGPAQRGIDSQKTISEENVASACDASPDGNTNIIATMPVTPYNATPELGSLSGPFRVVR